jgi:hypothetical protein
MSPGSVSSATTMALAPDGRVFVAEQAGRLRVIKNSALLSTPFLTVPAGRFEREPRPVGVQLGHRAPGEPAEGRG